MCRNQDLCGGLESPESFPSWPDCSVSYSKEPCLRSGWSARCTGKAIMWYSKHLPRTRCVKRDPAQERTLSDRSWDACSYWQAQETWQDEHLTTLIHQQPHYVSAHICAATNPTPSHHSQKFPRLCALKALSPVPEPKPAGALMWRTFWSVHIQIWDWSFAKTLLSVFSLLRGTKIYLRSTKDKCL